MSETKWSPEPWRYDEDESPWLGGALVFDLNGIMSFNVSADDARRIVACVNACAGIPTDALESGVLGMALEVLLKAQSFAAGIAIASERDGSEWSLHKIMGAVVRDQAFDALRSLGRLK